jgi:hypothetical protein
MEVTKTSFNSRMLEVDDQKFERVTEFKYIVSTRGKGKVVPVFN